MMDETKHQNTNVKAQVIGMVKVEVLLIVHVLDITPSSSLQVSVILKLLLTHIVNSLFR